MIVMVSRLQDGQVRPLGTVSFFLPRVEALCSIRNCRRKATEGRWCEKHAAQIGRDELDLEEEGPWV